MAWNEQSRMTERASMGASLNSPDGLLWKCRTQVEKYYPLTGHREYLDIPGNVAANGGMANIWNRLLTRNPSTSSTGAQLQAFSTGNARIGLGNSTATAAATQTDLQGASKKYNGMDTGYPLKFNVTTSSGRMAIFQAIFTSSQANFAVKEWGIFNSTSAAKRMLNRKQQDLGTKTSAARWTVTLTLSVS
jgi:hypothetical protein